MKTRWLLTGFAFWIVAGLCAYFLPGHEAGPFFGGMATVAFIIAIADYFWKESHDA